MLRGTTRSGSSVPRRIPERNENMETLETHSSAASTAALWQPETGGSPGAHCVTCGMHSVQHSYVVGYYSARKRDAVKAP